MIYTKATSLLRRIATFFVVIAVLWGSVFAPAHATAMAMDSLFYTSAEPAAPCPMSGGHAMSGAQMMAGDEAGDLIEGAVEGDMSCCPPPAVSSSGRFVTTRSVTTEISLVTEVMSFTPLAAPGVDPRPPQG